MDNVVIATNLPVPIPVAGHHEPAPFYLTSEMFGGLPVQLAGGELSELVGKPVAELHRHKVPEIYFLISPTAGTARIAVAVDGVQYELRSPACLYVPAGAAHRFVTLEAERGSYCFGLLLEQ